MGAIVCAPSDFLSPNGLSYKLADTNAWHRFVSGVDKTFAPTKPAVVFVCLHGTARLPAAAVEAIHPFILPILRAAALTAGDRQT